MLSDTVLLLSPGVIRDIDPRLTAVYWLKIWLQKEKLPIEEYQTSTNDVALCDLCAAVNRAAVVIADASLRDPQVYIGLSLARSDDKPVRIIAYDRAKGADAFGKVLRYPASVDSPDPKRQRIFEREGQELIADLKQVLRPPDPTDSNRFREILKQHPGERSDVDQRFLKEAWQGIVNYCGNQLPESERMLAMQWYHAAFYDYHLNLLIIRPPKGHWQRCKTMLQQPNCRHLLEKALFKLYRFDWSIAFARIIILLPEDE